jgi:hypothetical protein
VLFFPVFADSDPRRSPSFLPGLPLCSLFSLFAPTVFHNSFAIRRFRTLSENCRVSLTSPATLLKSYLNLCFTTHKSPPIPHFSGPLFSCTYKLPIFYPLSFDILTNARGCRGAAAPSALPTSNFQHLTSAFSYSSELFCTFAKLNSFLFKRFRILSQKHPGVGVGSL